MEESQDMDIDLSEKPIDFKGKFDTKYYAIGIGGFVLLALFAVMPDRLPIEVRVVSFAGGAFIFAVVHILKGKVLQTRYRLDSEGIRKSNNSGETLIRWDELSHDVHVKEYERLTPDHTEIYFRSNDGAKKIKVIAAYISDFPLFIKALATRLVPSSGE